MNIHRVLGKFLSLIPSLVSAEDGNNIEIAELGWAREVVDVSVPSKLRVLTGVQVWCLSDIIFIFYFSNGSIAIISTMVEYG